MDTKRSRNSTFVRPQPCPRPHPLLRLQRRVHTHRARISRPTRDPRSVPEAGREKPIGDDDGERGAAIERERARRDGEGQTRVDKRAEVCGRELGARRAGRRWRFLFRA